MQNTLRYGDFVGSVELDAERDVLRGKVLFIADLVTYEASTPAELKAEFHAAVDDYLETCKEIGKEPQKSFTGQFNVRIEPDCHKALAVHAASDGRSLNAVVAEAVHWYLNERNGGTRRVEHVHKVVVHGEVHAAVATASGDISWESRDVAIH